MKKSTFVVSMLLVALSTAGVMLVGQSYAASGAEPGNCVTTIDYSKLTPQQLQELQKSFVSG
ncbi:MAG: hypothetical protein ACJ8NR_00480 [Sulfurifustis sp.]